MMRIKFSAFGRNQRGAAAVEFALVAPVMILLLVGGMYMSIMGFNLSSLHASAEKAARCAAMGSASCTTSTEVEDYAGAYFLSMTNKTATFAMTTPACGFKVSGTTTYSFDTGVARISVPMSTEACFPAQTTIT